MSSPSKQVDWGNVSFLAATHLVALVGTPIYLALHGPTWQAVLLAVFFALACGFGVTGGYHRLFSHASYKAHPVVRALLLFFGAGQFENSALKWSADHRRHHAKVDTDEDPYNIRKGFWWAHVGWVLFKEDRPRTVRHPDLEADPLVMFQHRHFVPIAVFAGLILPALLGAALGDAWGGFLLAGVLRLVLLHHSTFCVNSVAHYLGSQPYSDRDSSRDSFVTALLSMGEGYHNYHHRFPADYRNGVRAWQFDPTKWGISALAWMGFAHGLNRVPEARILKARLAMEACRAKRQLEQGKPVLAEALDRAHAVVDGLVDRWAELKDAVAELRRRKDRESREALAELRRELEEVRAQLRRSIRRWRAALRQPEALLAFS